MRMNYRDLRHLAGNQARVTASSNDGDCFARKQLRSDSCQNLANQSTVAEDGAGTHRLTSRFADSAMWLSQRQPREQRCPLVKIMCHRFESGRDRTADIAALLGNDIESRSCAKVHNDCWPSIKAGNSRGVRQAIRPYRLRFGIIDRYTQFNFPAQPEHLRLVMRGFQDR